jgi:hypothetical protein
MSAELLKTGSAEDAKFFGPRQPTPLATVNRPTALKLMCLHKMENLQPDIGASLWFRAVVACA